MLHLLSSTGPRPSVERGPQLVSGVGTRKSDDRSGVWRLPAVRRVGAGSVQVCIMTNVGMFFRSFFTIRAAQYCLDEM